MRISKAVNRLGTESAFQVLARAQALAASGRDIINLGIGQPDFRTPDNIVEAGIKALRDGHHGYTPANGLPALREAVVRDLANRNGVQISPERVVIQPGGKPTMFYAMLIFGQPGADILTPDPGFPIYRSAIDYSGASPVPYPLTEANGFAFDADDVLGRITDKTSLIIINSPANPTGGVTPMAEIDKLVKGLEDFPEVALLSDEIYSRMLYGGRQHVSLLNYPSIADRLIMLDGWSKTYAMTGWRLGYAIWPEALVEIVTRLCINDHSCVNAATQMAGIEALEGPQDAVDQMMLAFDARRLRITELLNALNGVQSAEPGGAFYAFANISGTGLSAQEAQDLFLNEAGVAAIAGTSFGDWGEGFLRFSYANSIENIEEAMARIGRVLAARA